MEQQQTQQPQQQQPTTPESGRSTRAAANNLTLQVRDNIVNIIMGIITREYNNVVDVEMLRSTIVAETDPLVTITTATAKKASSTKPTRVEDIATFFGTSTREQNDATNKVREPVLTLLSSPPTEFLTHETHGAQWTQVSNEWNKVMTKLAPQTTDAAADTTAAPHYKTKVELKGGRVFNYDADITFLDGETGATVAKRKAEFKYNATRINELPQFLSLKARDKLFPESIPTYDEFYYTNYLDKYIAIDTTGRNPNDAELPKPPLEEYLKMVTKVDTEGLPFFAQLKERESLFFKKEKSALVDESITQYLTLFGSQIDVNAFTAKLIADETDKHYILWKSGQFHYDTITQEEMSNLQFHSIKNGNTIVLQSAAKPSTTFHLLLRWRNHKGILNPAWQISLKRTRDAHNAI